MNIPPTTFANASLVTGSEGFIGRALTVALESSGQKVFRFDQKIGGNITCISDWSKVIAIARESGFSINRIYHLAGIIDNSQDVDSTFSVNLFGTLNMLSVARELGARVLMASTTHVDFVSNNLTAADPYSTSKACADLMAQCFAKHSGINLTVIRHPNVFGPGDLNFKRLVPATIKAFVEGREPRIDSARRSFIHINDVIAAYMEDDKQPVKVLIGHGPYLVSHVVKVIKKLMTYERSNLRLFEEELFTTVDWYKKYLSTQ